MNEPFTFCYDIANNRTVLLSSTSGEHTYSINKKNVSTMNPSYLPKYLQYGKETAQTITDEDYIIEDEEIH